jgi:predicted ABC-type ATPase
MTPTLYLIAGPNGAGKSTYFDWAIQQQLLQVQNGIIIAQTETMPAWVNDIKKHIQIRQRIR